jgi:GH24 family phage-related lysozyme (muramidase)
MALPSDYLNRIKQFEGFYAKPYWDYKQWTSGYGTRASGPNDVVDQAEAERRLQSEIANAAGLVDRFAPNLDPGTRAALTSLTFNAGGKWMESGLGQAIKSGDMDRARATFLQYANAGGQHLPGLAKRRAAEVAWFGQQPTNDPRNTTSSGGGYGVDPDGATGVAGAIQTAQPRDTGVMTPQQQTPASAPLTGSQQGMGLLAETFNANEPLTGSDVFKAVLGGLGAAATDVPLPKAPDVNLQMAQAQAPRVDLSGLSNAVRKRRWGV